MNELLNKFEESYGSSNKIKHNKKIEMIILENTNSVDSLLQ